MLEQTLDKLPISIFFLDKDGLIQWLSGHAEKVLGYGHSNSIGRSFCDLAPSSGSKEFKNLLLKVPNQGDTVEGLINLYDVRGFLNPFVIKITKFEDKGYAVVLNEIPGVEDGDTEFDINYKELYLGSPVGLAKTDEFGLISFANYTAIRLGVSVGGDLIDLLREDIHFIDRFNELLRKGRPFEQEICLKDGVILKCIFGPYSIEKEVKGALIACIDVSKFNKLYLQEKKVESLLHEYMASLETVVSSTRLISSYLDKKDILKAASKSIKKLIKPDALLIFGVSGKNTSLEYSFGASTLLFKLKKPLLMDFEKLSEPILYTDLSIHKDAVGELLKDTFGSAIIMPISLKGKNQLVLFALYKGKGLFKRSDIEIFEGLGKTTATSLENAHMYGEINDFARKLEKTVLERTAELQESNRLKDLFVDIMGHDLLKPAEVAKLTAELALEREETIENRKIILNIFHCLERMVELIQNATMLSKLEAGECLERKKTDLTALMSEATAAVQDSAAKRNMTIDIRTSDPHFTKANPLVYDVFLNLLGNAVKYGKEGTVIEAGIETNSKYYRIWVADEGDGIPDEYKKEIFTRFKRVEKGSVQGTGLGLAIVKRVVDAHEGSVWVEDNPCGGSVFNVKLPIIGG